MFATRADLLMRVNANRLLQLAVPTDMQMVDGAALRDAISGVGLAAYDAATVDVINAALVVIDAARLDAQSLIESYGVDPAAQTAALTRIAVTLAMYFLAGNGRCEGDEKEYAAVIKLLESHAKGVVRLTPTPTPEPGVVVDESVALIYSAPSRYAWGDNGGDW